MGFGTELQGRASHEALIQLQDTEIRLLDNIKKCLSHRVKCDKDYSASLSSIVNTAQRFEVAPEFDTPVYKAWTAVIKETEFLAHLIRTNSEKLGGQTLEQLAHIINEKKSSRKFYVDERSRLETEYSKLQTEVSQLKSDYERLVIKLNQEKNKYEELCNKGKGGSKLENARQKYHNAESKLQKVHNEYIVQIKEANLHQRLYLNTSLPGLLDYQQEAQESSIQQCKDILEEYAGLTNHSSDSFTKCHEQIFKHIGEITPSKEYAEFLAIKRTDALQQSESEFSDNLLLDYKGTLKANEIALNNLTVENVKLSRSSYEDKMVRSKEMLSNKKARLIEAEKEAESLSTSEVDARKNTSLKLEIGNLKREVAELTCLEEKFTEIYKLLNEPLITLVDSDVPLGIIFPDNATGANQDDSGSVSSHSAMGRTSIAFNSIKSAITKKIVKRQQTTDPPKPPSRDFVDVKMNGEGEDSDGGTSTRDDSLVSDGYQQYKFAAGSEMEMTMNPDRHLEEEEWFHGVLPREEVQKLLVNDGDYIVRASVSRKTGETQYVLSVMWQGHKHFIIQGSEETGWRFEGESYPTIQGLLIQQHKSGLPVTKKSEAILKTAILKEEWELRNDDIVLGQKIGNGNFGDVFRGNYKPKNIQVAVKTCRETLSEDAKKKFLQEGRILKQFKHPNIVEFIGIAAQKQPVMIVMEYVPGGALLNFLRKKGADQSKKTLVKMCTDAASGMQYLESKNCIHRDLAARNCLVGKDSIVKISDFGMSREEEEYTVSGGLKQIPIKWTAPEALNYGRYTTACDVWSFGILVWEIFSFGAVPYPGMTNQQAKEKVDEGYRLPAPIGMPLDVYSCVQKCWQQDDTQRPRFAAIYKELKIVLEGL